MEPIRYKDKPCDNSPVAMLRHNTLFLTLTLLLAAVIGYVLLRYDKAAIHLWMNTWHTPFLDGFFRAYTAVGEWVPYVVVFLLLFYKAGWSMYLLSAVAGSGLLSQGLKFVFNAERPYYFFSHRYPEVQLPFVDGVELSQYFSFPSGHTTSFFAFFLVMSIVLTSGTVKGRIQQVLVYGVLPFVCWIAAVLGAYSRIYLSQHFLVDIFGGMLLGVIVTVSLYPIVPRLMNTRFGQWHIPHFWEI